MSSSRIIAALAVAMTVGASAASAIPLARPADVAATETAPLVEKVHGWHSYCARGPARWHRHVPGAGNVPCGPPARVYRPYRPAPRVIIVPRGPRRWR